MSGIIDQVLVPELYRRLNRLGDVRVSHRGEANVYGHTTCVNGRERRPIEHWGESYAVACCFCDDRRAQLSINHEYGQPGADGWPMTYLAKCFNQDCLRVRANRDALADAILGPAEQRQHVVFRIEGTPTHPDPVELAPPGRCVRLSDLPAEHPAVHHLTVRRQYPRELFDYYGLEYCLEADPHWPIATGRIIIPIWFRGTYVGWQAQLVGEPRLDVPPYFTFPGLRTAQILYNFDRAVRQPIVVVVPSALDVWTIGDRAVATLGDRVSAPQHHLLAANWPCKPVIFVCNSARAAYLDQQTESLCRAGHSGPVGAIQLPPGREATSYGSATIHDLISREVRQASVA